MRLERVRGMCPTVLAQRADTCHKAEANKQGRQFSSKVIMLSAEAQQLRRSPGTRISSTLDRRSRCLPQSRYVARISIQRNGNVVHPRQHLQYVEENGFPTLDPWNPYATLTLCILVVVDYFLASQLGRGRVFSGTRFSLYYYPGKLILSTSSTIIEDIRPNGDPVAFFYFDAKHPAKSYLRGLLSSILVQLCNKSDQCYGLLSQLYIQHNDGTEVPSEDTLVSCLKRTIKLLGRELEPVYLIIDGLDECQNTTGISSQREKVLGLLRDLDALQHSNLHVCVTSGLEHDIRDALEPLTSSSSPVSLHEEDGQREDIIYYVKSLVNEDREMRHWGEEDRHRVIKSLSERADGMYGALFGFLRRCR